MSTKNPTVPPLIQKLVRITKNAPVKFSDLCDKLELSPAKLRKLMVEAERAGVKFKVKHDHIALGIEQEDDRVHQTHIAPVIGERQMVAVISDLHYGSRYCRRDFIKDFVEYAHGLGVRDILCPGDIVDGNYVKHGLFELSHVGLDNQVLDVIQNLPKKAGLRYHAITGNHDLTFEEQNGVAVGKYIESEFRAHGRNDIKVYGNRGAFLRINGVVVHLWHPGGGSSYAVSYKLQKRIEAYASGEKPHILLAGHWHRYCHVLERGVHGFACPTFQGGGSAFGKSLASGAPAIGGMILEWDLTAHGTIRNFKHEYRAYYEREKPQQAFTEQAHLLDR